MSGFGPRDADLVLRDGSQDLTGATSYVHNKTLRGGVSHTRPLGVSVLVPSSTSSGTLAIKIEYAGLEITIADDPIVHADPKPLLVHIPLPFSRSEALVVTLTTNDNSDNFGKVQVWLESAGFVETGERD